MIISMLSIAICDDEAMQCLRMAGMVGKILDEMKILHNIRQFNSGKELLCAEEDFDIIFLDIMMRGIDGMRTAKLLRKRMKKEEILIFISASREYALEAFEVEAFWYLLKPVDEKKLRMVLQKIIGKTEKEMQEFILVSKERQKKKLFLNNIYYFEIRGRTIDVHGADGIFTYYEQIGNLEKMLQKKGFFRCHKSYLVNLKYVESYTRQEILMDNGEQIMIAKRRYEAFCQEILAYMRR